MFFGRKFRGYHRGTLSGLDVLVLSMIKNKSEISGYDIIQKLNNKFKGMWTASAGTIYPMLNRLEEKGLIEAREVVEGKRQKKVYNISMKGIEELKKVLEDNLESSINSVGDFIKTIFKAMPSEEMMDKMMCRFPFPEFPFEEKINETDYSLHNIERIERILVHLKHGQKRLQNRMDGIEKKISKYSKILEKLKQERNEQAKPIEIIDDDEEFENF
ncbi:MAG: PadR family transcriptional regulator [Candidatus Hermodarchaeota archaeon]